MEDQNQESKEKKVIRYHLVRHKWPDEIAAERNRRMRNIATIATCIVCFIAGFLFNGAFFNASSSNKDFEKLTAIYELMESKWYFGKDVENLNETLINNAINGLLTSDLDAHTMYMSADESQQFVSSLQGNFVGIGIQYYAMDEHTAIVDRVFKNSGAEKGGMMRGDIIQRVDGVACEGKTLDEISAMIKGEEGTTVQVVVLRENKEIELTLTRSVVNDSVFGYHKDNTGIIEINSFSETSGDEVGKHLVDFQADGRNNLIIDLRDNGGGYVNAAMQIGSYFVEEGDVIYKEQSKNGTIKEQIAYSDYPKYKFDHIVILVNEDTASASEVLASCLKEQLDNVQVVGTKSYGKGTVQVPIKFDDGSSFKYTIAEWLTPSEEHINRVGITPDVEITLNEAITTGIPKLETEETFKPDSVSIYAKPVQIYLDFLGYKVDRSDEYFSTTSSNALKQYQREHNLQANGEINAETVKSLLSSCSLKWHQEQETLDVQMQKALELVK